MAFLGSLGTAVYRREVTDGAPAALPDGALDTARETLGGASTVAGRLPGAAGESLLAVAREPSPTAMRAAAVGGAAVLVGAAVPAAVWLRRRGARCDSGAEPVRAEAAALGNQRQTL